MSPSGDGWFGRPILRPAKEPPATPNSTSGGTSPSHALPVTSLSKGWVTPISKSSICLIRAPTKPILFLIRTQPAVSGFQTATASVLKLLRWPRHSPFNLSALKAYAVLVRKELTVLRHIANMRSSSFPMIAPKASLDAYGRHAIAFLDEQLLVKGVVTAVGAVHQDAPEVEPGHSHFPKTVCHYWSGYTAEISGKDPHPKTLLQYIHAAQAAARNSYELSLGVEKIASGIVRLAGRIGDAGLLKRKARTHRAVVEALETEGAVLASYRQLLRAFLIEWASLTEDAWTRYQVDILGVACALCEGDTDTSKAGNFLAWPEDDPSRAAGSVSSPDDPGPNVYRVTEGTRNLDIRLGSIHSVKGQTHLATMLLSTYWHAHSSKKMLPWFLGEQINGDGAGKQDTQRLLQTFVAMTRPSYLLCLAIPRSALGGDQAIDRNIEILKGKGWSIAEIIDGLAHWQD